MNIFRGVVGYIDKANGDWREAIIYNNKIEKTLIKVTK